MSQSPAAGEQGGCRRGPRTLYHSSRSGCPNYSDTLSCAQRRGGAQGLRYLGGPGGGGGLRQGPQSAQTTEPGSGGQSHQPLGTIS